MGLVKVIRFFLMIVLVLSMIYIVGLGYIKVHESIHRHIFLSYGINSETTIDPIWLNGITVPEDRSNCNDYCKLQHALNSIVGYHIAILIFNTWALFMAWFVFKLLYRR